MHTTAYETVIGLEVHIQLNTQSKAFCGDGTTFGAEPNTQVSAISLGHPGTLPRLNKKQLEFALRLGLALGSKINSTNTFDRKNYFYADLPKGYQITQDRLPICVGGGLQIKIGESWQKVGIHHIHMEEDAGKSIHPEGAPFSQVDLNRAGVPLLEVVTEPDLRSAEEVDAFMTAMRRLVRYLDISDGNMEQGSMRCDVNISIRPKGSSELGQRCEIKNINSMRYARQAIAFEVKRQISLVESGNRVEQQTRSFDPSSGTTSLLRDKEDAHDYRYFPEPDLPPVVLSPETIKNCLDELPRLPHQWYDHFCSSYQLSDYDASLLIEERAVAVFFSKIVEAGGDPKAAANLLINKILPWCQEEEVAIDRFPANIPHILEFLSMIEGGAVSPSNAYQYVFPQWMTEAQTGPLSIAERLQLIQTDDADTLQQLVDEVLRAFPEKVATYRKGKKGLLGFFMGEIMKRSKGQAEPKRTNALLREALETTE